MLHKTTSYEAARQGFSWHIPEEYNIGVDVCDKWAESDPHSVALVHEHRDGTVEVLTYSPIVSCVAGPIMLQTAFVPTVSREEIVSQFCLLSRPRRPSRTSRRSRSGQFRSPCSTCSERRRWSSG